MEIKQLVLKVASRCNLNCTYCYMYNMGDQTFSAQPKLMSDTTITLLLNKVKRYCVTNNIKEFDFVLHGGEPLLAGMDYISKLLGKAKAILLPEVTPRFSLQTNGVLIDEQWSRFFRDNDIFVGVSMDGPGKVHDLYRKYHSGKGSFNDVLSGINTLSRHNEFGILSVINIDVDPAELYELIKANRFDNVNLLFPEASHDKPPLQDPDYFENRRTAYADWLIQLYTLWRNDHHNRPSIFIFRQIISLILGMPDIGDELIGTKKNTVMVIETDGSMEAADTLRIVGNGFTKQGLNISDHDIEDAINNPLTALYINSHQALSAQCVNCPIKDVCGAGMLAHRYKKENGFNNPTIYCHDMIKLITCIQNDIVNSFPGTVMSETGVKAMTFEDVISMLEEAPATAIGWEDGYLETFRDYTGV